MKKKMYLLSILCVGYFASHAQTESDLRQLDSSRKILANSGMVYPYIDSSPGYPGGNEKWKNYVDHSTIMKQAIDNARTQGIPEGTYTVVVKFAVNADGSIGEIKTVNKPVGFGLEGAAVKLVQGSGKWLPANVEGKDTKGFINLPVNFRIIKK